MEEKSGWFTGLDIRSKGCLFILFMVWTILFNDPVCHTFMLLVILWIGMGSGLTLRQMLSRLVPLLPLFLMIMLFTGFTTPAGVVQPDNAMPLITFGESLHITKGGLLLGLTFLIRLINMVVFTLLILTATPLDDFINLFVKLKLSRTLSFIITTAIRFVPELDRKRERIIAAQKARGIDLTEGSRFRQFRARIAIMVPLIVNAILIADQLTMALMNRGFGYRNQWTMMTDLKFRRIDIGVLVLCTLGIVIGIWIRLKTQWVRL